MEERLELTYNGNRIQLEDLKEIIWSNIVVLDTSPASYDGYFYDDAYDEYTGSESRNEFVPIQYPNEPMKMEYAEVVDEGFLLSKLEDHGRLTIGHDKGELCLVSKKLTSNKWREEAVKMLDNIIHENQGYQTLLKAIKREIESHLDTFLESQMLKDLQKIEPTFDSLASSDREKENLLKLYLNGYLAGLENSIHNPANIFE